jgi:signal transduction histidine kinase
MDRSIVHILDEEQLVTVSAENPSGRDPERRLAPSCVTTTADSGSGKDPLDLTSQCAETAPRADNGGMRASTVARSHALWPEDREQILARYLQLLANVDSPLLQAGSPTMRQIRAQLYDVVDSVALAIGVPADILTLAKANGPKLSETIGRSRASGGIHASKSLQAAALIFEAALPTIAARLAVAGDDHPGTTAALLLNREILQRMAIAARGYVDHLLDTAQRSNSDERRRLSRELHDVAAPAVAHGLQNLELFDLYRDSDPGRASAKIQAARDTMRDALTTIRGLSAQSRENVGDRGLANAIQRYLDTLPTDIHSTFGIDGDLSKVSLMFAEELFLIIREAVRNAVDHGHPRNVAIQISVARSELHAQIQDDGGGFVVADVLAGARHVGIDSMHERAELLGAELAISSNPPNGTLVTVRVALPVQPEPPSSRKGSPAGG